MSFLSTLPTHYWTLSSTYARYGMIHQDLAGSKTLSPVNAIAYTYDADGPVLGYTQGRLVGYDLGRFFGVFIKNPSGTIIESSYFSLTYDATTKLLTWTVGSNSLSTTSTITDWKRVIVGYDDTGIYLWIDGTKYFAEATVTVSASLVYFDGRLAELGTWDDALSNEDVEYLQNYIRYPFEKDIVTDSLTVSESVSVTYPFYVTVNDTLGIGEYATYNADPFRLADALTVNDSATCVGPFLVSASDEITVTEDVTRHGALEAFGSDTVIIEELAATSDKVIAASDSVIVDDSYDLSQPLKIAASDDLLVYEKLVTGLDITFEVVDEVIIIDAASQAYEVDASDDLTVEDSDRDRTPSDSLTLSEGIIVTAGPMTSDSFEVTDSVICEKHITYSYSESLAVSENVSYLLNDGSPKEYNPT